MTADQTRAERKTATAARILDAARAEFGTHGERATVRGIARRAGVDPALVLQHYGSKGALFSLAVRPVDDLSTTDDATTHLVEVLADRLRELPPETRALMRSMLTSPEAAAVMRDYLQERIDHLASAFGGDDAEARAAAVVAGILGITIARHFLDIAPLSALDDAQVHALVDGWVAPVRRTPQP